jgi:hypothetical protein
LATEVTEVTENRKDWHLRGIALNTDSRLLRQAFFLDGLCVLCALCGSNSAGLRQAAGVVLPQSTQRKKRLKGFSSRLGVPARGSAFGFLQREENPCLSPRRQDAKETDRRAFLLCVLRVLCERTVLVASKHQKPIFSLRR